MPWPPPLPRLPSVGDAQTFSSMCSNGGTISHLFFSFFFRGDSRFPKWKKRSHFGRSPEAQHLLCVPFLLFPGIKANFPLPLLPLRCFGAAFENVFFFFPPPSRNVSHRFRFSSAPLSPIPLRTVKDVLPPAFFFPFFGPSVVCALPSSPNNPFGKVSRVEPQLVKECPPLLPLRFVPVF